MQPLVRIGTRASKLAQTQSRHMQARIVAALGADPADADRVAPLVLITTTGDRIQDRRLLEAGGKALFVKEIEEALLAGEIDVAIHSMKDVPAEQPPGLAIAAVPEREDPRDAIVGKRLADLPAGARVGTSSLRRSAQLRKLRPDLVIESIRGNLDTRLRKLDEGQYDAIVLAAAGLKRLGWGDRIAEVFDADVMCSAVGQGALAIETRATGPGFDACRALDHPATHSAVLAERGVLGSLGGGCQVPIGAHARIDHGRVHLLGLVAAPDGSEIIRAETDGPVADAEAIGKALGGALLDQGARRILEAVYAG